MKNGADRQANGNKLQAGGSPHRGGRPRLKESRGPKSVIDWPVSQALGLGKLGLSHRQLARVLGCSASSIDQAFRAEESGDAMRPETRVFITRFLRGSALTDLRVRKELLRRALDPKNANQQALIFACKNFCGMADAPAPAENSITQIIVDREPLPAFLNDPGEPSNITVHSARRD